MELKFSERLSGLMEECGLTVKQLSKATGISVQSIYTWKKENSYKIYLSNLIKLCDALKCSLEFLLDRAEAILDYTPKICPVFYNRLREIMKEKGIMRYRLVKETKIYDITLQFGKWA